jgi:hypothetical protein
VRLITLLVIIMLLAAIQPPEEMPMTKLEKKALILLTETELDHIAGGNNTDPFKTADFFNWIAQLLNLPWWAINVDDSTPFALGRNRGLSG